jgi:hypothetical protein
MTRKTLRIVVLLAYVAGCVVFLAHFRSYLLKPGIEDWNRAHDYLRADGRYRGEPVRFSPGWLKNYATDLGRFKGFDLEWSERDPVYWHLSTGDAERAGYRVVMSRAFGSLVLRKLVREEHSRAEAGPRALEIALFEAEARRRP